ncbi:metal-dependent hydrolase [Marinobacter zhanjiangensis]|uniref:Integral membrane protein n=1 Tax=Marinobacter zhanjiangensis TaxID=578215 RepID=A0ABQ3ALQ5_9GAMM|nr:metal-dependent hydrolase [Marinobacter zhanjiangensis]GGY58513.1 integral membrane protein [Marinobacter zhanjiangensis]
MDSVTQAALGACIGGAIASRTLGRAAIIGGAALGTLPDLDVVLDYGSAVANFTQHRGFSHSLFILVPLGVALALALHRWKPQLSLRRWLAFTLLILVTHPLLDTLTTYGTQLFWPLGSPLGSNSIFIIDPLYTLPLLFAILYGLLRPPAHRALYASLALSSAYLLWALGAQALVDSRVEDQLADRGLAEAPRMVQPMPFTTLLWRVTVLDTDERLEIVTGPFEGDRPLTVERFPRDPALIDRLASFAEGQRLIWFTDGFLDVRVRENRLLATDIRLGVPGAHPFTFVIARQDPDGHWSATASTREPRPAMRNDALRAFWSRLSGEAQVLCMASFEALPAGETCS